MAGRGAGVETYAANALDQSGLQTREPASHHFRAHSARLDDVVVDIGLPVRVQAHIPIVFVVHFLYLIKT